jgi:PAS domain S-box-containing protein
MSIAEHHSVREKKIKAPAREKEDELHLICDALPVLIAHVDAQERYCFNNRAYECWFGLRSGELYGRTMRQVLGKEAYQKMLPRIRAAFAGERQVFDDTVRYKDGGKRAAQINYIPRLNSSGVADGMYILITDITKHQLAEEQIRTMNAELEQRVQERTMQLESANKELEAFCYSVSHDLRAPLRAIRGFTDVLLEQHAAELNPRGQDFLRRVSEASHQMDTLVDDLLRLSRVSRSDIQKQEIDLSAIAAEILMELAKSESGRAVKTTVAPGLKAQGDVRLVRVVLDNLLRNAWKFTGKQPRAEIEFGRADGAVFFVRDNGVGFDMTYVSRLFGVFQRLHAVTEFPGSGVGLAIAQRVINRHDGRIWGEGHVDKGATFYFTLPGSVDS